MDAYLSKRKEWSVSIFGSFVSLLLIQSKCVLINLFSETREKKSLTIYTYGSLIILARNSIVLYKYDYFFSYVSIRNQKYKKHYV